jgi:hypothetical protein
MGMKTVTALMAHRDEYELSYARRSGNDSAKR